MLPFVFTRSKKTNCLQGNKYPYGGRTYEIVRSIYSKFLLKFEQIAFVNTASWKSDYALNEKEFCLHAGSETTILFK